MCFEKHSHLVFRKHVSFIVFVDLLVTYFIYFFFFTFLNLEGTHPYCIWFKEVGCSWYAITSVNSEQYRAEIGSFNECLIHSILKLHQNLFNLFLNMLLVVFSIIALTVCYIIKCKVLLYLTILFLYVFLPFLSTSVYYSNFSHFCKLIFFWRKHFLTTCTWLHLLILYTRLISCIYFCSNT